jgi:hypothetical protein
LKKVFKRSDSVPFAEGSSKLIYLASRGVKKLSVKSATVVIWIRPETKRSSLEQAEIFLMEGRTCVCRNKLRWFEIRSEKLIDFGDSWFSAKTI